MWNPGDITLFFSIFGFTNDILESLSSKQLTKETIDGFTEKEFHNLLGIDECTARVVHLLWNEICSFRHCAQDAINRSKETLVGGIILSSSHHATEFVATILYSEFFYDFDNSTFGK
jgi:hypothetical protein